MAIVGEEHDDKPWAPNLMWRQPQDGEALPKATPTTLNMEPIHTNNIKQHKMTSSMSPHISISYSYHIQQDIFQRIEASPLLHRHDLRGSCTKLVRGHQKQRGRAGVAKDRDLSCWSLVDPGLWPKDPGRTQFAGGNHGEIGGRSISLNLLESSKMAAKLPMLCDDVPIWMFIY